MLHKTNIYITDIYKKIFVIFAETIYNDMLI